MLDADTPYPRFPPTSRLEYTHGDTTVVVEVPPEHSDLLISAWKDTVRVIVWPS